MQNVCLSFSIKRECHLKKEEYHSVVVFCCECCALFFRFCCFGYIFGMNIILLSSFFSLFIISSSFFSRLLNSTVIVSRYYIIKFNNCAPRFRFSRTETYYIISKCTTSLARFSRTKHETYSHGIAV